MVEIKGKAGIVAKVLCDSISEQGIRLITYELTYARMVHAELLTHGMLVRNAASSRAIPFKKMVEQLTARPVRFGQANPGMQDRGVDYDVPVFVHRYMKEAFIHWLTMYVPEDQHNTYWCEESNGYFTSAENWWEFAGYLSSGCAEMLYEAGFHKQVYNRLCEAHQMIKVVLSGTELENYFWLRKHGAADPTLEELAKCMHEAREKSVPAVMRPGDWHLPYVDTYLYADGTPGVWYGIYDDNDQIVELTLDQAIKVSCARTAAVSFRNEDYGLEKCLEVYARLVEDERKHASAMQHQATPMKETSIRSFKEPSSNVPQMPNTWEKGITHMDSSGQLWSAQFKGWIMHRKTIPGENYTG